jgi:hypothetical protein
MLCNRCEDQARRGAIRRRSEARRQILPCDRCGAAILTLVGVAVGVGDDTLTQLARFGLASTERPLLEPTREGA